MINFVNDSSGSFEGIGSIATRLAFFTQNTEKVSILNGGNVGIGTAAPSSKLTVAGAISARGDLVATGVTSLSGAVQVTGMTSLSSDLRIEGNVSKGTWQGTAIARDYIADDAINSDKIADNAVNGTHIAIGSDAAGDILYYNGTDYVRLAKGSDAEVLTLTSGVPSWVGNVAEASVKTISVFSTVSGNSATWTWVAENSGTIHEDLSAKGIFTAGNGSVAANLSGDVAISGNVTEGTWQGTDVAVAHGGTGSSTLPSGEVLLGNGTSAITTRSLGINNDNIVEIDSGDVNASEYAQFTANGLKSRTNAEVAGDIGSSITALGTITTGIWHGDAIEDTYISSASAWNWVAANSATSYSDFTVHGAISAREQLTAGNGSVAANLSGDVAISGNVTEGTWQC